MAWLGQHAHDRDWARRGAHTTPCFQTFEVRLLILSEPFYTGLTVATNHGRVSQDVKIHVLRREPQVASGSCAVISYLATADPTCLGQALAFAETSHQDSRHTSTSRQHSDRFEPAVTQVCSSNVQLLATPQFSPASSFAVIIVRHDPPDARQQGNPSELYPFQPPSLRSSHGVQPCR